MIRKYKLILYILLLIVGTLTGFIVGVNYAVNNTTIMDGVLASSVNIATINNIRNNKLDSAVKLQMETLDTNLAIIDEIDKNGCNIIYFPQRGILYLSMLRLNLDHQKQTIKSRYKLLRNDIK